MLSLYCTRTWFAGQRESNLQLSDQKSKVLHGVFRIKKSENVLAPDPCWKWIICPDIFFYHPPPPSGLNGRPAQSTLYIGALILERSFAEFSILHHPPVYEGIFLIPFFTVNDNGHWWMKNIWPKFRQKKSAFEMCRTPPPPPPPLNKMVVDNITTTATRHCLNDIWIHRSQKYFKKFPSVFSAVFAPRFSYPTPPPPLSHSQVDCIDPTLIFIDLRTLYTVSFSHLSRFLFQFRNDRI